MAKRWMAVYMLAQLTACGGDSDETRTMETDDTMTEESDMQMTMREGPPGCYVPSQMACDCELAEADCLESAGMVWVDNGCASCE